jgi:DNA gyrase subunit A
VGQTDGDSEILLGTRLGMAIRFPEDDLRSMGRTATGVRSISLRGDDSVVDLSLINEEVLASGAQVLAITELGYGKRTPVEEYRLQSRGGTGIHAMRLSDKTGPLAGQRLVHEDEDLLMITDDGTVIRMAVADISSQSRNTQGVRLMRVAQSSRVVCLARAEQEPDEPEEAEEALDPEGNPAADPELAPADDLSMDAEPDPEPVKDDDGGDTGKDGENE